MVTLANSGDQSPVASRGPEQSGSMADAGVLRRHASGLVVATLMAVLVASPHWWLLATHPPSGTRVLVSASGAGHQGTDEIEYALVSRRAFEGDVPVRDPQLPHHSQPPLTGVLPAQVVGALARPFGDLFLVMTICVTITALLGFLLLYALAADLAGPLLGAAFVPVIALVGQVYIRAQGVTTLRHVAVLKDVLLITPPREFMEWGRYTVPVMLLAPVFGALLAIPRAVERGDRRWIGAGGFCLAVIVYSYFFYWTALGLALAAWLAWLAYRRDWTAVRRLIGVGLVATILALPELVSVAYQSVRFTGDVRAHLGVAPSVGIDFPSVRRAIELLVLGVPLFWGLRSGRRRDALYVAMYVAPLGLGCVTGVFPQPWHYLERAWSVLAIPAMIAGTLGIASRPGPRVGWPAPRAGAILIGVATAAAVAYFAVLQVRTARDVNASFALSNDDHAAMTWMSDHLHTGDTVVSASITTNQLVATLTPASVYLPDGFYSHIDDAEQLDRYLRASAAFGYDASAVFDRLDPSRGHPDFAPPYEQRYESYMAYYLVNWEVSTDPARVADRVAGLHDEYTRLASTSAPLTAYPAQYLYCGYRERLWPASHPAPGTYVTVAFQQGDTTVYRIADASDPRARLFAGCG